MYTLVIKSTGCAGCQTVKRWLSSANLKEGTYSVLKADDGCFDWMAFCKRYNVQSVPALVNLDTEEVILGVGCIIDELSKYKEDENGEQ